MKWALIFVFMETGIYETGLTFRTFEDCTRAAMEIRETETFHPLVQGMWMQTDKAIKSEAMQCVPTK